MDLDQQFFGNPLWRYLAAAGSYVALVLLLFAIVPIVRRMAAKRVSKDLSALPVAILARTRKGLLTIVALAAAVHWIELSSGLLKLTDAVIYWGLGLQVGHFLIGAVEFFFDREEQRRAAENAAPVGSFGILRLLARGVVWIVVLLIVLSNVGVDVTGLAASLGIGGIAVALAAQNILGDLFASLSIVLDRPFEVGHFVTVGEHSGTVERIGLKTTRIKSISGEQLVFSNNDLLSSRIRNFRHMEERRILFSIGLLYSSDPAALRKVPAIIKEIIDGTEHARFDRAHLLRFGASSLEFEIVYFVEGPDFMAYAEIQQSINLALFERLRREGLDFAFPSTSLYVESVPPNLRTGEGPRPTA